MKINYNKSELVPINLDQGEADSFKSIMGCEVGQFPIKYLGIPLTMISLEEKIYSR
jgi:hypothetical protein